MMEGGGTAHRQGGILPKSISLRDGCFELFCQSKHALN